VSICHTAFPTLVQDESADVGRGNLRQTDRDELGARAKEQARHTRIVAHDLRRQAAFLELISLKLLDELFRGAAASAWCRPLIQFAQVADQRLQASIRDLCHITGFASHSKKLLGDGRSKLPHAESRLGQPLTEVSDKPTV